MSAPGSRRYAPREDVRWSSMDGETVLVDLVSDAYFVLNATGACVWEALRQGCTVDQMVESVCSRFEATQEAARRDVARLIEELREAALVQSLEGATA